MTRRYIGYTETAANADLDQYAQLGANVQARGAVGDGTTDDYAALARAASALGSAGRLFFPPGTYRVGTNLTVNCEAIFALGATLEPDAGVTVTLAGPVTTAPGASIIASGAAGTVSITGAVNGSGVLDVRTFGAVGDGVTDDTAAFQRAVNACGTRGGVVYIPPSPTDYRISSQVTLTAGVTIRGAGSSATRIKYTQTSGDCFYYSRPDVSLADLPNTVFEGFSILGPVSTAHTSGAGIHVTSEDVGATRGSRTMLRDVSIRDMAIGFELRNIQGLQIENCTASYCNTTGFRFRGFTTLAQVTSCFSFANDVYGWDVSGVSYSTFSGCGGDSNGTYGWYVHREPGDAKLYGCTFNIGAEQNGDSQAVFDTVENFNAQVFCIARVASPSVNGIVIEDALGFVLLPLVLDETTATGFPVRFNGTNVGVVILGGGYVGAYNGGANRFNTTSGVNFFGDQSNDTRIADRLTLTDGKLYFGSAASQLVPGTTSFSVRNNADNADNLIIADSGTATARNNIDAQGQRIRVGTNTQTLAEFHLNSAVATQRNIAWYTANVLRWLLQMEATAEPGSDVGGDLVLKARNDAGGAIDDVWEVARAAGSPFILNRPLTLTAATPTVAAGQVGLGDTTSTTVGAAGAAAALPATPSGYLVINVGGTAFKVPYYAS